MISIHDLVQNAFVYENVADGLNGYWLGLRRSTTGADWVWSDGSHFDFSKWGPDQPPADGQRCGHYGNGQEGDWSANDCNSHRDFLLCQINEETYAAGSMMMS